MYHLTLTAGERKAIDWIGHRYAHGNDLYKLLWTQCGVDPIADWDHDCDLIFTIGETVAWEIQKIGEESNFLWDCFGDELVTKLNALCNEIV